MKRNYEEVRTYDVFGPVRISYEFAGDINEQDFTVFLRDFLCKTETEDFKLNNCPRTFVNEVKSTCETMGILPKD